MRVAIGRNSGPVTDLQIESDFTLDQLEIVKDVLMMVNKASNNKERWYYVLCPEESDDIHIPYGARS